MGRTKLILDDDQAYGQAWAALPIAERRRISRAVNRGEALHDPTDVQLAVMTARRQQSFWRWAWLLGPALLLFSTGRDLVTFLLSVVITTAATGGLSLFFLRRARRAEQVNLELATKAARRAAKGRSGGPHPNSQEAQLADARREGRRRWWQRR